MEKGGLEDEGFKVWYGREGVTVWVLAHKADEEYEEGREFTQRRVSLP